MAARVGENVSCYVITAFVLTYVTTHLKLSSGVVLTALLVANAVHLVAIPLFGALSDRVGRRPVYLAGALGTAAWAPVFFHLLDTRQPALIIVAVTGGLFMHAAMYGPQAAFFAKQFDISVRYSATSIGYQVTSIFAGSLAPIIAVALLRNYGSATPIVIYIAIAAAISVLGILAAAPAIERRRIVEGLRDERRQRGEGAR